MIENYEQYNNQPQQDKESMIAKAAENSNTNEGTLISQTDQVESLLTEISGKLSTLHSDLSTLHSDLNTLHSDLGTLNTTTGQVKSEVTTQGQAIVTAIQSA